MDDPDDTRKKSRATEGAAAIIGVGLFIAAAVAPASLTVGLCLMGGLALVTTLLTGAARERACRADEPCGWYRPPGDDSSVPDLPPIAASHELTSSSRWSDAVRDSRAAEATRRR